MNAAARARILLVDDSTLMRKAASKMLGEEFDVVTAVDGVDAWDKIQADTGIQVVFTDLLMPRLDGFGLLRKVREDEDEGTLNLPVIVVTGAENDDTARKKALDLGATDFITKPFSSIDLLARARAHANYRRITRKLESQITLDGLTGLANKAGFFDRLQQDIAFAQRHAQPLSIARIEIDDFRAIFLSHGKAIAEGVIAQLAQALHARVRKEDTAGRIGLASFALSMPAGQHAGTRALLEQLRAQIAGQPIDVGGKSVALSFTAAVITPLLDGVSAEALIDRCEQALQEAIRAGGNRVVGRSTSASADAPVTPVPGVSVAAEPAAVQASRAERESKPAAPAPTRAAPVASPITADEESESIDEALRQIDAGHGRSLVPRLPQLLARLTPLLRLLSARQRSQLVSYLNRLE